MYFFKTLFSYSLGKYSVVGLLNHMVILFLIFWGTSILFSIMVAPVFIPTQSAWMFLFFYIFANTYCFCVFNFSHSDRCEVISHCGFDLHFPDEKWCWASFHVFVDHLDVFFGKMSMHVFCLFLHWNICFSGVEFGKFFIDFGY